MSVVKFTDSIDITRPEKKRTPKPQSRPRRNERTENDIRENIQKGIDHAGGKYVKFDDIDHTEGLLVGGVKKEGKHYFAVMNRDKVVKYVSPNEHFSILRNIPASLYILDYVYRHDADYLYERALDYLDHDKASLFTNCYIKRRSEGKKSK